MKLKIKDGGGEKPVWQIQEQIGDCQFVFTKPQKRSFDKSLIHLSADWFVPEVGRSPGRLSLGSLRLKNLCTLKIHFGQAHPHKCHPWAEKGVSLIHLVLDSAE